MSPKEYREKFCKIKKHEDFNIIFAQDIVFGTIT